MNDSGQACAHERSVLVWDVPPAIDCGSRFGILIGAKCGAGCPTADWQVGVFDHRGHPVRTVAVGDVAIDGTAGLHGRRLELVAPGEPGHFTWRVCLETAGASWGERPLGASADARFKVRTVEPADWHLTVVVADRGRPIADARVVAHPYRTRAGPDGVARLAMPAGRYRLLVSGPGYLPLAVTGELEADTTIRVELVPDTGPSDAEIWS